MIKVELDYFQKLIIISCEAHIALSENKVYFVFFSLRERKATREKRMSVLLLNYRCFGLIEKVF